VPDREPKADAKPKRPRKRAALAAVTDDAVPAAPSPTPKRAAAKPARSPERLEKDEVAAAAPVVAAPVQAARPVLGAKKKRELPPYLRVVK
jgi:hypothetical protein